MWNDFRGTGHDSKEASQSANGRCESGGPRRSELARCQSPSGGNAMENTRRTSTETRLLVAAMFVAALIAPRTLSALEGKKGAEDKQWRVKYAGGSTSRKKGANIRVTVGKGRIVCETVKKTHEGRLTIPVGKITDISDAVISGSMMEKAFGSDDLDLISDSRCSNELTCAGVLSTQVAVAVVAAPFKFFSYEEHFVRIEWSENGEKKYVNLRVGKKDCRSLLAELRIVSGLPFEQVQTEEPAEQGDVTMRHLAPAVGLAAFRRAQPQQGKRWSAKLGLSWDDDGPKAKVIVNQEEIYCDAAMGNRRGAFSIPVADVTEVAYFPLSRPVEATQPHTYEYCRGSLCVHPGSVGEPVPNPAIPTPGARDGQNPLSIPAGVANEAALDPESHAQHHVRITWRNQSGEEKQAVIRLSRGKYLSFLAEVQRVTGIPWKDKTQSEPEILEASDESIRAKAEVAERATSPREHRDESALGINELSASRQGRCSVLAEETAEYQENCARGIAEGTPATNHRQATGGSSR